MPDYIDNILRIYCDDNETMETIGELLFKRNADGRLYFTMTKFLPLPEGFDRNPKYTQFGHNWCISNWGTKWDVISPTIFITKDEIELRYETAWDQNDEWPRALCRYVDIMTFMKRKESIPQISIMHSFSELASNRAGHLYWKPLKEFKYQRSSVGEVEKRSQEEYERNMGEYINDQLVFEMNIDSYLPDEDPPEFYSKFPDALIEEVINELKTEMYFCGCSDEHMISTVKQLEEICSKFTPLELLAIYSIKKDLPNEIDQGEVDRDSLLKAILTFELEEYKIGGRNACHLFLRLLHIPLSQFKLFIQVIFDSEVIGICQELYLDNINGRGYKKNAKITVS